MKKVIYISIVIIASTLLGSCDFVGKTKQIVEFTPNLKDINKGISSAPVVVEKSREAILWNDANNIGSIQPENIELPELDFSKFKYAKLEIKRNSPIIARIVASEKDFFVLDGRANLYSFSIEGLEKNWQMNLADDFRSKKYMSGSIVYKNGLVYVSYGANEIVAIDAEKGVEKWRRILPDIVKSQISIDDSKLYALTVGNRLHTINAIDGTLMWDKRDIEEIVYQGHYFAPILSSERVYVPFLSGLFTSFNKKNAEEIWSKDLMENVACTPGLSPVNIQVQPILTPGFLYIASPDNILIKMNVENGDIIWSSKIHDIKSMSHCASSIFITTNGREVAAIDKNNGKLQWSAKLYDERKKKRDVVSYFSTIIVNNKLNIASSNGELFIIDPTNGNLEKNIKIPSGGISSVITHNRYFIFTDNGIVYHNN